MSKPVAPSDSGSADSASSTGTARRGTVAAALLVGVVALASRLVPVLRGGGLFGLGNYDDAVHFAATVGLVNGVLPYRDFLFLQPPGILVLLAPFAALGQWIGDPRAFALARLGWMAWGATTAALVAVLLRRFGWVAMLAGGLTYAVFFPVSYVERTTLLEGPQNTLLVVAMLLLGVQAADSPFARRAKRAVRVSRSTRARAVLAGCALGLIVTIKIWGVAAVIVVVAWLALGGRRREALATFVTATASAGSIYLAFFVPAPGEMWQMVVVDQLGRGWVGSVFGRLVIVTGLSQYASGPALAVGVALAVLVVLAAMVLAVRSALGRLAVATYLLFTIVLLSSPSQFLHYGALLGAPTALVLGAAVGELAGRRSPVPGWRTVLSVAVTIGLVVGLGSHAPWSSTGSRFPINPRLRDAVAASTGCVTFDDAGPALQLDVVRRNLARGCPLVVDLGGRSYHPPMIMTVTRSYNPLWQAYALSYLESGRVALIYRFRRSGGFSAKTRAIVRSWPLLAHSGPVDARQPPRR